MFTYNNQGIQRTRWEGPALAPGRHTIEFDFRYDQAHEATGASDGALVTRVVTRFR